MLRATSEMAVTISVRSMLEKPSRADSSRPFSRAATTSASVLTWTSTSSVTVGGLLELRIEKGQPLLEVQGGVHVLEAHSELDHGEGHLGLNPNNHRLCAAQSRHVSDRTQRPRRKRVHHVQRRDVHDDPARAEPAYLLDKVVLQLEDVTVAQGRLNRSDQVVTLLEDWDSHSALPPPRLADLDCFFLALRHLVAKQALRLLDASLEVADGVHLAQVHADRDQGLRDLRGEARDDHAGAHEARRLDRLDEVVRHRGVDRGHA